MTAEEYLKEHGISEKTQEKFNLIFTKDKVIIPVKDAQGKVLYNKYRHLDFDPEDRDSKKYSFDEGSKTSLFNVAALDNEDDYIFVVEGEMDCIKLDQEGIHAVTNTAGASSWKEEWGKEIDEKIQKVYVLYDNDPAGETGADKVIETIPTAFKITLPKGINDICDYFKNHTLADFRKLVDSQVKQNTLTYPELCEIIDKWLLIPDKNVVKILLACLVSHFFATDPLWMFFVAPPSGSKTELISTVAELPFVRMLSDLTPQTFASGLKAKVDPSLLLQLQNHILVMKDFTTVLTMRQEERQMILSQLREIYDGRYSKAFGTGKVVEWEGRLSFIAGVTPIIDTHSAIFQVMGERFIMYRVPQSESRLVAKKALTNYGNEKQMRLELRIAIKKFFLSLSIPPVNDIELPDDILEALASIASFTVVARSGVVRDHYRKDLLYIPTPEAPARLAKQLGVLIKALAVVDGRKKVNWEDFYLTLRVAFDVIPSNRMSHIQAVCGKKDLSTTAVASITNYSTSGSELILEDLTALEIIKVQREGAGHANLWSLSSLTESYFKELLPIDDNKLWEIFPKESQYMPIIAELLKRPELAVEPEKNNQEELWTNPTESF